ncbi:MAG: CheY-like chemotaxis protein, partial [Candidatus Paceibacteria bacterium]
PEALGMIYDNKPAAIFVTLGLSVMRGDVLIAALGASTGHRSIPVAAIVQSDAAMKRFESYAPAAYINRRGNVETAIEEFLDQIGLTKGEQQEPTVVTSTHCPRVLLAEDSPTSQLILARMLHVSGADVTVVEDGEEVLTAVEAADFDLILMDIEMPKMDGMEAASHLRDRGVEIPIIAVTGYEEANIAGDQFEDNFDGFLQKPVSKDDLRALFRLYHGRRGRRGRSAA